MERGAYAGRDEAEWKEREEKNREDNARYAAEIEERSKNASPKVKEKIKFHINQLKAIEAGDWAKSMQGPIKRDFFQLTRFRKKADPGLKIIYKDWTDDELRELYEVLYNENPEEAVFENIPVI